LLNADVLGRLRRGAFVINTARAEVIDHAALLAAVREKELRVAFDVFPDEPAGATGEFHDPLIGVRDAVVYGTHHIGASTDQAQEAIAGETVRIIRSFLETGRVPNVVNLAVRTPATHMLVVRHRDRPGVLAHVFNCLRARAINVQETENIVFEGAHAAVARVNLDAPPDAALLDEIRSGNSDILDLQVVELT
jgi:D-3-phosphoglycerate dehydrogenase